MFIYKEDVALNNLQWLICHKTKPNLRNLDFYHQGFSDYCLHLYSYFHNILADMSSGLLQVFAELGNLHRTWKYVLY